MKSKIYKITNDVNDKIYVGKTNSSIEERFKQHLRDACKKTEEKRPLYNAINKYGKEHFFIELIEECDFEKASERERYWIEYYKGYENGYNATLGGDGTVLYDYKLIEKQLLQGLSPKVISEINGCCKDVVYKVAKMANINLRSSNFLQEKMIETRVKVNQYTLNGEFIQTFNSYADAARWLIKNKKTSSAEGGIRTHIGEVCNGTRKTAYKYIWRKTE